ncbi:glycosyltransferase [Niabella beijingensis]|uniref:glycosyltransferase n=1 Tax=Niabella beijingensis TaxID=2872700 RepID=UPI001CBF7E70|nr:glycosyltransferase [Niabella beijingensis]MBZ4191212.1 glycosyltransferase [Niabella beijingensis]
MLKVLWLCSWYPNKVAPFEGDFVQRHAQAASLYNQIHVIKVTPDPEGKGVTSVLRENPGYPHLIEEHIYYPKRPGIAGKLRSYFYWYHLYKKAVTRYISTNGKPDLVHVHIPFKSGLIAQWIKKKYGIPYVVTEHWGGYNTQVENNYRQRPFWFRQVIRDTLKNAAAVHSVSRYLGVRLREWVWPVEYTVIPNVVNTRLFFAGPPKTGNSFDLLHISTGASVKNVQGIINAFLKLDPLVYSLKLLGLTEALKAQLRREYPQVLSEGTVSYEQVGEELRKSNALLIFSHAENSPCVIGEALCCGVPVIATDVGGIAELVDASDGILVTAGDEEGLVAAIERMYADYMYFPDQLAEKAAERYSYQAIGKQFDEWYRISLSPQ